VSEQAQGTQQERSMKEHISINGFSSFKRLQEGTALLAKPTVLLLLQTPCQFVRDGIVILSDKVLLAY
jgi:hypothetical protein